MSPSIERCDDLVIGIGAQKAATSSVWAALRTQGWFAAARRKELHFFSSHHDRGPAWYHAQFPTPGPGRVRGEITPDYLRVPQVAARIRHVAPDARLFAILRHPVDRAYSAYLHGRRTGDIPRRLSFEEALSSEPTRRGRPFSELYEGGLYARQLQRFLREFPEEQLHVELYEDLVGGGSTALDRILRFSAPEGAEVSAPILPHRNVARTPLPAPLARLRTAVHRTARNTGMHALADGSVRFGRHWTPVIDPARTPMAPGTRESLLERYARENEALSRLLGRPLPGWDR